MMTTRHRRTFSKRQARRIIMQFLIQNPDPIDAPMTCPNCDVLSALVDLRDELLAWARREQRV
jgi:hypothetical protein